MAHIEIRLFGPFQITAGGQPLSAITSEKIHELIAYLAVEADRPHGRERLAELLWSDRPGGKARQNLRQSLSRLQRSLPDSPDAPPLLVVTSQTVQFNPQSDAWVDVRAFDKAIQGSPEPAQLQAAANLVRGEFLAGIYADDAPEFSLWLQMQRDRLHSRQLEALGALADHAAAQGDWPTAIDSTRRILAIEPWREAAHRDLMRFLAQSGQYSAALAQYDICRRLLAEELAAEPMEETVALYARIQGVRNQAGHSNLPTQPTPFVGRQGELAHLHRLLSDREQRLITVVGPGGIGKTRLALQGARTHTYAFLDGVIFVPLADVVGTEALVPAIANAAGLSFAGDATPHSQLLAFLRNRELLLLLDDFEHLLEGDGSGCTALIADILAAAPAVTLLVTSREPLNLRWESRLVLAGLTYPQGHKEIAKGKDALATYSALRLFAQTARRVRPGFEVDRNLACMARVCQLAEGMPLAIELAATWLRVLPCAEIAREIAQGPDILSTSQRHVPQRQRSIRAVFDHSWRLLNPAEQEILMKLSVFRGGCDRDAARQVTGATLPILTSLVDKSLLQRTASGRYSMHTLVRQFAAEQLAHFPVAAAAPETPAHVVSGRHSRFYLALVQEKMSNRFGELSAAVLADIQAEMDNVRKAWQWAIAQADLESIGTYMAPLSNFYIFSNLFQEGQATFSMAVDRVRSLVRELDTKDEEKSAILGRLLAEWALMCNILAMYDQAIAAAQSVVELSKHLSNPHLLAWSYGLWGWALFSLGRYSEASEHLESALEMAQEIHFYRLEAHCYRFFGSIGFEQGLYEQAESHFQRSLQISRRVEERQNEAWTLAGLGLLHDHLGEYQRAKGYLEESLDGWRESGPRNGEGFALADLGLVHYHLGDLDIALDYAQQALNLARELNARHLWARALENRGHVLMEQGRVTEAAAAYQEASELRRALGQSQLALDSLAGLARVHRALGHPGRARREVEKIVGLLKTSPPHGTSEPARIYLTCHQVLVDAGDPRAGQLLQAGYDLLQARAGQIEDPGRRQTYLHDVPVHREILELAP